MTFWHPNLNVETLKRSYDDDEDAEEDAEDDSGEDACCRLLYMMKPRVPTHARPEMIQKTSAAFLIILALVSVGFLACFFL